MLSVLETIIPLFGVITLAFILKRFFGIGKTWEKPLNDYAFTVAMPALLFSALAHSSFTASALSNVIVFNSAIVCAMLIASIAIAKIFGLSQKASRTLLLCSVFGNVAYIGIPVLSRALGDEYTAEASVIASIYIFWIFVLGIMLMKFFDTSKQDFSYSSLFFSLLKNPLLIATLLGGIVAWLSLPLPDLILSPIKLIASSATPVVLIVIGLFIAQTSFESFSSWIPALFFSLFTLILFPTVSYCGVVLFGASPNIYATTIVQASMPLAITPFALAERYNLNKQFIARSIVLSTILSLFSLPLWIWIVG
jgi:predicted permease